MFQIQQDRLHYVKRFQMIYNLEKQPLIEPELPPNYVWVPWHPRLTDDHARIMYLGFRGELDSLIFPSFRRFDSCLRFMRQTFGAPNFLPKTCWLIGHGLSDGSFDFCATIQGIQESPHIGGIQNLAVLASSRRLGLAEAILCRALRGFRDSGCRQVSLDVTAENTPAIHLYRKVGFVIFRTTYKETWLE